MGAIRWREVEVGILARLGTEVGILARLGTPEKTVLQLLRRRLVAVLDTIDEFISREIASHTWLH